MKKIFVLLLLGILFFGCTQIGPRTNGSTNQTLSGPVGGVISIHIKNFAFDPSEFSVTRGSKVIWVNDDGVPHSIKASGFESPTLSQGASYEHVFTEAPGDYSYICGIHPAMHGKITVTP